MAVVKDSSMINSLPAARGLGVAWVVYVTRPLAFPVEISYRTAVK